MHQSAKDTLLLVCGVALLAVGGALVARTRPPRIEVPNPPPAVASEGPQPRRVSRTRLLGSTLLRAALVTAVLGLAVVLAPLLAGWQVYVVEGASMEPSIPIGSLITVRPALHQDIQIGDVITFVDVAHRQS